MHNRFTKSLVFIAILALALVGVSQIASAQDAPPVTVVSEPTTVTDPTAVPPVTVVVDIDPGPSPDVSTEQQSSLYWVMLAVVVAVGYLWGKSARETVRSREGLTITSGLANYKDAIPGPFDDMLLSLLLRIGQLKLRQRTDGWWEVIPKEDTPPRNT